MAKLGSGIEWPEIACAIRPERLEIMVAIMPQMMFGIADQPFVSRKQRRDFAQRQPHRQAVQSYLHTSLQILQ